jgi:hypothetical protein
LNPANTDSSTIWHFHWTDSGQHLKSAFAIRFRHRNNGSNFSTVLGNEHFLGSVNNRAKDSAGFSAQLSKSGLHKYEKYTLYFTGQALSNERALRSWRENNHGFQRWARMIPASWDWQKKKQESGKPACRVFVFALPHSRRECTRSHLFISVFIRVISGFILVFSVERCDLLVRRLPAMRGRLGRGKTSEPDFHRQQHKGTR